MVSPEHSQAITNASLDPTNKNNQFLWLKQWKWILGEKKKQYWIKISFRLSAVPRHIRNTSYKYDKYKRSIILFNILYVVSTLFEVVFITFSYFKKIIYSSGSNMYVYTINIWETVYKNLDMKYVDNQIILTFTQFCLVFCSMELCIWLFLAVCLLMSNVWTLWYILAGNIMLLMGQWFRNYCFASANCW